MPDLDRVERTLDRLGQPPEAVGEQLTRCLAEELRPHGGTPGFAPFLAASITVQGGSQSQRTLGDVSRALEQRFGQTRNAKILARAVQKNDAKVSAGRALPGPSQLAEEYFSLLIRHHFFDRVLFRLVGEDRRFADACEARAFESSVWLTLEKQIPKLAKRFLADPTASKLRAPRSLHRRRSTAELLESPV